MQHRYEQGTSQGSCTLPDPCWGDFRCGSRHFASAPRHRLTHELGFVREMSIPQGEAFSSSAVPRRGTRLQGSCCTICVFRGKLEPQGQRHLMPTLMWRRGVLVGEESREFLPKHIQSITASDVFGFAQLKFAFLYKCVRLSLLASVEELLSLTSISESSESGCCVAFD